MAATVASAAVASAAEVAPSTTIAPLDGKKAAHLSIERSSHSIEPFPRLMTRMVSAALAI